MFSIAPVERSSSDVDLVAAREQLVREVGADEARTAGDQVSHEVSLP